MKEVRLSIMMDENEHKYLKMCCAKLGVSIKDFVVKSVTEQVYAQEDIWWLESEETKALLKNIEEGKVEWISFDDAMKELALSV